MESPAWTAQVPRPPARSAAAVALAIGVAALPGAPLERVLGASEASAATKVTQLVFNQDRTIRPRRSVPTKVFCPGRFIPFTWGFRPINPPIPGVVVNAILTSVVPDERGTKKAGFTITLFNPNPGATVQIRVSTTCVEGSGGVGTRFRAAAVARGPKPTLALDTESAKVEIPAGQRVAATVSCDRKSNAAIADVGFASQGSEYVGFVPTTSKGRPAARVVIQNRSSADDSGRVYANCIEGRSFKVSEKTVDAGGIAATGNRTATSAGGAGSGGKPGLLFERTRFTGTADPFSAATLVVQCGEPKPVPDIQAIGGGASSLIGPETGPALEQFVFVREALILNGTAGGASARRDAHGFPLADPAVVNPGTLLQLTLFGLLNLTGQPAAVTKTPVCVKSSARVRTLVDPDSDVEDDD